MREENHDRDLDIVLAILQLVPELPPERALEIEHTVRAQYGGLRTRIAKRKKHPTPEERARVINQALDPSQADVPTDQIAESNGISRRTLYRYLKRGAR